MTSKQVLDSVDSLSIPSEPPHIGNWFSSYAYESPVLSGVDDFQDYDGSRNMDSGDGRKGNKDDSLHCVENVASQGDIELPIKVWRASDDIPFSSVLSESLDTKDCFSSCVPETPLLADSDDFRVPESIDIDFNEDTSFRRCKKDIKSAEEDSSAENQTNGKNYSLSSGVDVDSKGLVQCTNSAADNKWVGQDVDSSDDISLASEPPDIRNWFSSYVYESPKVDTVQDFILPDHDKELDDEVCTNGYSGSVEPQTSLGTPFIHDDKYEHQTASKDQEADETKNTRVSNEMPHERISQQVYHKTIENSKCGSSRYFGMVFKGSDGKHLETLFPQEANCEVSCIIDHSSCEGEKLYRDPIHRMDSAENSSKSEDSIELADDVRSKNRMEMSVLSQKLPKRKAAEINKENHINDFGENGFISTRKIRNSQAQKKGPLPRPAAVQSPLSGVTVTSNCHKHGLTRKILTDTTNLHPSALETTGKWRCPQRTKPNLGPPLKQLRLEKWVRRA